MCVRGGKTAAVILWTFGVVVHRVRCICVHIYVWLRVKRGWMYIYIYIYIDGPKHWHAGSVNIGCVRVVGVNVCVCVCVCVYHSRRMSGCRYIYVHIGIKVCVMVNRKSGQLFEKVIKSEFDENIFFSNEKFFFFYVYRNLAFVML